MMGGMSTKRSSLPPNRDLTTTGFLARHPKLAADVTLTAGARIFYCFLFLGAVFLALLDWRQSTHFLYVFYGLYTAIILFRLLTVIVALFGHSEITVKQERLKKENDQDWPHYTVLVPLYREPEVAAKIVRYVDKLDYPRNKLQVFLILEQDDDLTRRALEVVPLPDYFRVINVPDTQPRTKPKACNWGLKEAQGEFLVIYDAEDRPDPDQLKKAVIAFREMPEEVICLQAKLSYYNPDQNLLTRWFTIEYAAWFDLYLPGLYRLKFPIPLGGTSNHLRRRNLEEIGGWDPFNVAEDCDLGIRLHRMGYRTAMLDTTTWEEANSQLRNWVRQRSRWVKGYLQTHLVHTRNPWQTFQELRPAGIFSFLMSVGGYSLLLLINPVFWVSALVYLLVMGRQIHNVDFYSIAAILITTNLLFISINLLGCLKRRLGILYLLSALLSPFYWALISIAAWKGFLQLLRRPHFWEKTNHGLFHDPPA